MTLAIAVEPQGFVFDLTQQPGRLGGIKQPPPMVHNLLTVENDQQVWLPELAEALISVERGTWRLNPDGTMDTAWRIRPNVKWHDGTPFTADDLHFSWGVFTDTEIPNRIPQPSRLMASATVVDPLTLNVHWSAPYANADRAPGLVPLPRHLMEEAYLADKANFGSHPRLSTEFVGLGPYRLVRWETGSHLELAPFADYWRGRPPLDGVVVRFLGDPNTMVANILAGALDVVLAPGVDLESALEVRQRWAGTGNQVLVGPSGTLRLLDFQLRPEYARPRGGLTEPLVRQALYHAIDCQALSDVITQGLAPTADSWFPPGDPVRKELEADVPQYPYDPARARQLLAQTTWTRGADGVLVNQQSGERFEIEIQANATRYDEQTQNIVGDNWKELGVQATLSTVPPTQRSIEYRATRSGVGLRSRFTDNFTTTYPHSRYIPTAQNRWTGDNFGAYSNPKVDALLNQMVVTLDRAERVAIQRELVREEMGEVAFFPLYWDLTSIMALKGVKGMPGGAGTYHTWNFFAWDKD
jgi:peptide/nickel transport system substrate-binding protein